MSRPAIQGEESLARHRAFNYRRPWPAYPVAGGAMEHVDAYSLYYLAESLGELRRSAIGEAVMLYDLPVAAGRAADALRQLLEGKFLPLDHPSQGALKDAARAVLGIAEALERVGTAKETRERLTSALLKETDHLAQVLSLNSAHLNLFFVPSRLAYDTLALLNDAGCLFGELASQVMALAGRDVEEAARCFAFGLSTASAFHILRACELVLREYCRVCGVLPSAPTSWAGYIAALGNVRDLPPRTTGRLQRLRQYDRNEIMHPGRFLVTEEADDLFNYVSSSMKDMMRDILARRAASR